MTADCVHCGETIEYRGARPKFCGFCGQPLDGDGAATTMPGAREAVTVAHTPSNPVVINSGQAPPAQIAGYTIVREIGRGGMGTVYEAEESQFGRKVALKLLAPEVTAAPEALERFRQEGRLASTMAHPRCVFVLKADEDEGRPFIVMELMPGLTLGDLVNEKGPMAVDEAVPKILDVIEGLREAHRLGLIHRDVKPSNCFIEHDGRVKVGDFGLSKSLTIDSHLTRTGSFLGTPLYASPEQIKGDVLDARTDVYSVAATLYYLLAGKAPFQGTDAAATLAKIVSEPPPPIRTIRPEIPAELERILSRGLERNRDRRYRDLGELANALLPFAPGRLQMGGLGLRVAAFALEVHLSKLLIVMLVSMVAAIASRGARTPSFSDNYILSASLDLAIYTIAFFIVEPLLGASPGKLLLGLRVRGRGTSSHDSVRILQRNATFWAIAALPWEAMTIGFGVTGHQGLVPIVLPIRLLCLAVVCSTMRASNGYAGVHDLLTDTRVVSLPRFRVRKTAGSRRALGRDRGTHARPVGVMKAIGPYKVRGAIRWEDGRKVLAAEDSSLGREVWIVLRPKASPLPELPRRELSRASRPRWLSGGEQAEGRWDAYIAPAGCPLADLAGPEGLPWRDARPILEDLAEELHAAIRDYTLPDALTIEQVWIQPDGRAMLVDQLGTSGTTSGGDSAFERARNFLHETVRIALMGGRLRRDSSEIRSPIPIHARQILDRLKPGDSAYRNFDELQADLTASQDRPAEVSRTVRAVQVAATTAIVCVAMAAAFGFTAMTLSGSFVETGITRPGGGATLRLTPAQARVATFMVIGLVAITLITCATILRGGAVIGISGCALATESGRPAPRWRCAWRSILVWGIPMTLLAMAINVQGNSAGARISAWGLFAVAAILVVSYAPLAILWPVKGPHDRLAGTVLVPK